MREDLWGVKGGLIALIHIIMWVPWNVFDQVCSFGLEVSDFFIAICMLQFFIAICILLQYRFFSSKSEGFRVYVHIA